MLNRLAVFCTFRPKSIKWTDEIRGIDAVTVMSFWQDLMQLKYIQERQKNPIKSCE